MANELPANGDNAISKAHIPYATSTYPFRNPYFSINIPMGIVDNALLMYEAANR